MKASKLLLIYSKYFLIFGIYSCSSSSKPTPIYTNNSSDTNYDYKETESIDFQKKMFAKYCQNGKQVKKFSYNIQFVKPKLPQNLALDQSNELIKKLLDIKECYVRGSIIELSQHCDAKFNCSVFYKTSDSNSKVVNYGKDMTYNEMIVGEKGRITCPSGNCKNEPMRPLFVYTDKSHPILLIFERTKKITSGSSWGHWYQSEYGDDGGESQAFFMDLATLRSGYTMLYTTPAKGSFDKIDTVGMYIPNSCSNYSYFSQSMQMDGETLEPNIALEKKDLIWQRYLLSNQTIQESQTDDPKIMNYEVSLDLNNFCTYGRHVKELVSY